MKDTVEIIDNIKYNVTKVGRIDFYGTENWDISTTKDLTQVFYMNLILTNNKNTSYICNKFEYNTAGDVEKITTYLGAQIYIAILKSKASTVAEFKTWLSNNPVTLYYELNDYIYTPTT